MDIRTVLPDLPVPEVGLALALAVISASTTPLILLDADCTVLAASTSFREAFGLPGGDGPLGSIFALGAGEWNVPRLHVLLESTLSGAASIPAYEIDLELPGHGSRRLVLNAHVLVHGGGEGVRLLLAIADVTDARLAEQVRKDLAREKAMLMQELQHRVANSLQIVASVLMQSARRVGSEARGHLNEAHSRVMSIAALQQQLAETASADAEIGAYLAQLCRSLGASMIDDHGRLSLESTTDHSRVSGETSVSIGLVVTELVINALKHGFPGDMRGHIRVDYRADGAGWRLEIKDDGVGMPAGNAAKPGLGTSIVTALARHLGATLTVADNRPGTSIVLHRLAATPAAPEKAA